MRVEIVLLPCKNKTTIRGVFDGWHCSAVVRSASSKFLYPCPIHEVRRDCQIYSDFPVPSHRVVNTYKLPMHVWIRDNLYAIQYMPTIIGCSIPLCTCGGHILNKRYKFGA